MAITWQSVPFGDIQNKADEICFASGDKNFIKAKSPKEAKLPKRNMKTPKWLQLQQRNNWVVTGYFLREKGLACTEAAEICVRNSEKP